MVGHRIEGWWPGTLVAVYDARTQDARRNQREPPAGLPLAVACADDRGVAVPSVPEGFALLAYGSRSDSRPGWVSTLAPRGEPPRPDAPQPEFGRPQPPPEPRKPTWTRGARGADLGRRWPRPEELPDG